MVTWEENLQYKKDFTSLDGNNKSFDVETFTWEKLDMIDKIKELIK